jgi:hypothetical protein
MTASGAFVRPIWCPVNGTPVGFPKRHPAVTGPVPVLPAIAPPKGFGDPVEHTQHICITRIYWIMESGGLHEPRDPDSRSLFFLASGARGIDTWIRWRATWMPPP